MSWFNKRKERNLIPPVQSESLDATSFSASRPNPATTIPSTDNNLATRDRYQRNVSVDVYSRGQANLDGDRKELFRGHNPEKASTGRFAHDGPTLPEPVPGEENEEDVEGIKEQTRFLKQEGVNSTRNALRMAREAEETARNTINRLGSQSEKLANTERHLDVSKGHSQRAEDRTDELKQLNRSIFRPVITFNKDAKRAAQEAKIQQRYEEERDEREKAMMDIRETRTEIGEGLNGRRQKSPAQLALKKEQRKRYQFEATASDDDLEDELDDNLGEISDVTKRLKALGMAMGQELDKQNDRIERIEEKTVSLDNRVFRNTEKVRHYTPWPSSLVFLTFAYSLNGSSSH
ncbi:synaptosome-associated proteinsynaptosomal-associated protein 25 [Multifurca ochricompacta]|uniref:Synaptosome-associated proteinsynaptosomal-associated protein 25 n=1 Tax=Multifurca ochricompacta TaxID=376703 RepID=A0AAD4MFT5_9AGAM|nr:synaptosome-associated proteinsynaptosomal-associated protein 25 [Multifurca ochricompacta]